MHHKLCTIYHKIIVQSFYLQPPHFIFKSKKEKREIQAKGEFCSLQRQYLPPLKKRICNRISRRSYRPVYIGNCTYKN